MSSNSLIARALAATFLATALDVDESVDRAAALLGRRWRWLRPLARRVSGAFVGGVLPRRRAVVGFILADRGFLRACRRNELRLLERPAAPARMIPRAVAASWRAPVINTPGELAQWLELSVGELEWFADLKHLALKHDRAPLGHYHYRPLAKRGGQMRMIESPKPRLKQIQRRILTRILNHIPPHAAAHGFCRGRSITTFAAAHAGKRVVARIDLQDFFVSIRAARIEAIFRTVGYPESVAALLAGLCSNATPADAWRGIVCPDIARLDLACLGTTSGQPTAASRLYAMPHLPQGAPTSPALANLCAYRLDCRLTGLASAAGAAYTRYADDLAFSGEDDFSRVIKRFHLHACAIAMQEGFAVHHRKTRIMRQAVRQRLAGIVVNVHPNIARTDYDRLKAVLTNCVRHGADGQNRELHENFRSHLLGRISFVDMVNPRRARKLRDLFDKIKW